MVCLPQKGLIINLYIDRVSFNNSLLQYFQPIFVCVTEKEVQGHGDRSLPFHAMKTGWEFVEWKEVVFHVVS